MRKRFVYLVALAVLSSACGSKKGIIVGGDTDMGGDSDMTGDASGPCMEGTTRSCGTDVGECTAGTETCSGGVWVGCTATGPFAEICNDLDEDCDGTADNGCDDDGDGYCDEDFTVVGSPAICPNSAANTGDDCDDRATGGASINLAASEVCADGVDNDCSGVADDSPSCAITVDINFGGFLNQLSHGGNRTFRASITPADPNFGGAGEWSRTWSVVSTSGGPCAPSDIVFSDDMDAADETEIRVTVPDDPAKVDCLYTIEVDVNGATDTVEVQMINRRPTIVNVVGAVFDGSVWRLRVPTGTTPTIMARAGGSDTDEPIQFDWGGPNVSLLACDPNCDTTDTGAPYEANQPFAAPISPGTSVFTVSVRDDFEPTTDTATVVVEADNCVWAEAGASGTGAAANDALGDLDTAITNAAAAADPADVCIVGAGTLSKGSADVPVSPSAPDIIGGFDNTAARTLDRPTIESSDASGLSFATGYSGAVAQVEITNTMATGSAVTIIGASPTLSGCAVRIPVGNGSTGVTIDSAAGAATMPVFLGGSIDPEVGGMGDDQTGVRVAATAGPSSVELAFMSIFVDAAEGVNRAIHILPRADANIHDNSNLRAAGAGDAVVGIDIEGSGASTATATIVNNASISASTEFDPANLADHTVAIRLSSSSGVSISGNEMIGAIDTAGTQFAAAIADGAVDRDGVIVAGGSSNLTIRDNGTVGGASAFWASDCTNPGDTGEATDVMAGIFLAGTSMATIENNGRPNDEFTGIFGGGTTIHQDASARVLPVSSVGLWLLDTTSVTVSNNETRAGVYSELASCPLPGTNPIAVSYRDGLPPNPDFGGGAILGRNGSSGTIFDSNGSSCARPPENLGSSQTTWCAAIEINNPGGLASAAPILTNNYVAATKGNFLIALWQRGGTGVLAVNNTFDSDFLQRPFEPLPPPGSLFKRPIMLTDVEADGITLANNIIYAHESGVLDGALRCIVEDNGGSGSSIAQLDNNLFFIEGDDLTPNPSTIYVELNDSAGTTSYQSNQVNSVAGVGMSSGNFASAPGLVEISEEHLKSTSRLVAGSNAIDAGTAANAPAVDMDGDSRPGGPAVDIGHDEF